MRKTFGMNKHQKAAHKPGERQIGREQIAEMLAYSESDDPNDRLVAAQNLCPCHVRTRIPSVWDALYRMMEDEDKRVRFAAWHTIEDGGKPSDEAGAARLQQIYSRETDVKVRKFAGETLKKVLGSLSAQDDARLWLAGRPEIKQRGKCDFCGESGVYVSLDTTTLIPSGQDYRAALICEGCAKAA